MNEIDSTSTIGAIHAEVSNYWPLSVGDWIQLGILIGLIVYVIYTARMSNDNRMIREYSLRPIIGINLQGGSEKHHIGIEINNNSNTDAMGLICIQLSINGKIYNLDEESYGGKKIWNFPAQQDVGGHTEFSAKLKTLKALADSTSEIKLLAYVYYKIWSQNKKEIRKSRKYYTPVKIWTFNHSKVKWIPDLTSKSTLFLPEPDWQIFEN